MGLNPTQSVGKKERGGGEETWPDLFSIFPHRVFSTIKSNERSLNFASPTPSSPVYFSRSGRVAHISLKFHMGGKFMRVFWKEPGNLLFKGISGKTRGINPFRFLCKWKITAGSKINFVFINPFKLGMIFCLRHDLTGGKWFKISLICHGKIMNEWNQKRRKKKELARREFIRENFFDLYHVIRRVRETGEGGLL